MNPFRERRWSPYAAGAGIGVLSWFAFLTANHPLGITTPFEHTAAIIGRAVAPSAAAESSYYHDESPRIGWEWMLVVGVFVGGLVSSRTSGDHTRRTVPSLWGWRFGPSRVLRLVAAFLAAGLMMFGARVADGCTSGHGISGALQLAVSSWAFLVLIFGTAIATAWFVYGQEA